ncbi:uncharacterized protein LOC131989977 [Centropristis striata]|uniref:uncharacterized protein LOC131989977 n=1 Tax=Centropristis striata TaxID=184440 RepID=UPI0027E1B41B|nr:uncharacterized protein LOC131989977 [Centropristis striata]
MMNFTLITALLCSFSLISVCVCELHTVEVQPGEDVTLMCSNFTSYASYIFWFRLADRSNISCISSMRTADGNASFQDGFRNGKFNMTSNITTLFLTIRQVDLSDSGLYFCGFYKDEKPVIDSATYLKVQEAVVGLRNLVNVILGAVIIFLITVIIGLVVKIRNLYTAHKEGPNPQESENLGSGDLNYAALSFHPKAKGSRRPASERELEPNVVYAATR